jgi:hypothetical protein
MMSYPPEKSKGKYISWFWMIFNLVSKLGSKEYNSITNLSRELLLVAW